MQTTQCCCLQYSYSYFSLKPGKLSLITFSSFGQISALKIDTISQTMIRTSAPCSPRSPVQTDKRTTILVELLDRVILLMKLIQTLLEDLWLVVHAFDERLSCDIVLARCLWRIVRCVVDTPARKVDPTSFYPFEQDFVWDVQVDY